MIAESTLTTLSGNKLRLARLAWWGVLLVFGGIGLFNLWFDTVYVLKNGSYSISNFLGAATILITFPFAVFLFWKKSDDWMAIVVSMMFVTTVMAFSRSCRNISGVMV